jgi:hypothetical protein
MNSFNLADYPYMISVLCLFVLFAFGYIISPAKWRRTMLLSALFSMPCCFASVFFVPAYWNPVRITTFIIGFEDLIFSFATGGIAWLLATLPLRKHISLEIRPNILFKRYFICILSGSAVNVLFLIIGFKVMPSALFGILSVGIIILILRRNLWPLAFTGIISFVIIYFIVIESVFWFLPGFALQWNAENLWAIYVWGVPLEEIIWVACCAAVWPLIMAYLFNAKIIHTKKSE